MVLNQYLHNVRDKLYLMHIQHQNDVLLNQVNNFYRMLNEKNQVELYIQNMNNLKEVSEITQMLEELVVKFFFGLWMKRKSSIWKDFFTSSKCIIK